MILYKDDDLAISANENRVYLKVFRKGLTMLDFRELIELVPRAKVTAFKAVDVALKDATKQWCEIGSLKELVELVVSQDLMQVYATVNLINNDEYSQEQIKNHILQMLEEDKITYGLNMSKISDMPKRHKILIAEGKEAIDGEDAAITYYELSTGRPKEESGKVDHYDLDLINNITEGEWLGQKMPATQGSDGMNVQGEIVYGKVGRDFHLKYDEKTVKKVKNPDGVEVLYAGINGAVKFNNDRIYVDNHLVIKGDVDYNVGHVNFDGYVTITGTVQDKFNVRATKDISINGMMGIGAVGCIESVEGSILIKGGINGKGVARIIAKQDVITKYCNESYIKADNNIKISLYALDSELYAKKIILPKSGRIIGGHTYATHRIETGSIGNKFEKPTRIYVEGFERNSIHDMLNFYEDKFNSNNRLMKKLRKELDVFERNMGQLDERAVLTYDYLLSKYEDKISELEELRKEMERLNDVLRTKGEGEISITDSVFPKTMLEIKKMQRLIKNQSTGSFFVKDREFHHK